MLWNIEPAHISDRRAECYLYPKTPEDDRVVHLLSERQETPHLVVADRQAVTSPSWLLQSGVGAASTFFVRAMAGKNRAFGDMNGEPIPDRK